MRPATVRQCVLFVDGPAGTIPKSLPTCGDRPFLAWKLREFLRFGVDDFVLLTRSEATEAALPAIAAKLPKQARIACRAYPANAGIGGALFDARDRLAERFLLCGGETLLDFNLSRLLADAAHDPHFIGCRAIQPRDAPRDAGIYLFDRSVVDVAPIRSLDRDLLAALAARGALRRTLAEGYFVDIGVPADLARAQAELPARLHRRALFLDRDGVINVDHGYVGTRDRFEWMPGAIETIRAATDAGYHVFVVTNQSGIARGLYDEAQLGALHDWMIDEIRAAGGTVDDLRFCPYHPEATIEAYRRVSDWRKPAPGMLLDLIAKWEIDPARSLLIGDQPSDLAAAAAAGIAAHRFEGTDLAGFAMKLLAP